MFHFISYIFQPYCAVQDKLGRCQWPCCTDRLTNTHVTSSLVKTKRIRITSANRPRSRPLRSAQYTLLSWNERCCNSGSLRPAVTADELVADRCIKVPATRRCAFAPADSLKDLKWLTVNVQFCHTPSKTACSSSCEQSQVVRLSSGNGALHFAQYPR